MPHHSASIGSSLTVTVKGLSIEELKEKFLKRQAIEFNGEGSSFFSRMGLLGKYLSSMIHMYMYVVLK